VVLAHVAEGGADAALGGHRVAARREQLGDAGGRETARREAEGRAQSRSAGADDDDVVAVIDEGGRAHAAPPNAPFRTANTAAASTLTKASSTRVTVRLPASCM